MSRLDVARSFQLSSGRATPDVSETGHLSDDTTARASLIPVEEWPSGVTFMPIAGARFAIEKFRRVISYVS